MNDLESTEKLFVSARKWMDEHQSELSWISTEQMTHVYAYFKQAMTGDNVSSKPPIGQLHQMAKWQAWTRLHGMSEYNAKHHYICMVNSIKKVNPYMHDITWTEAFSSTH